MQFLKACVRKNRIVTVLLVISNILVFVALSLMGDTTDGYFMSQHGAMFPTFCVEEGKWYLLVTSMFLHFGFPHLLNNMVVLFCVGIYLEGMLGRVKYLILYVAAGIGGNLLSLWEMLKQGDYAVSAGASGAIFGIIGGLLWVVIRNKGRVATLSTRGLLLMIALSLYYGFTTTDVDNSAHIGGLVTGFVCSMILYRKHRRQPLESIDKIGVS